MRRNTFAILVALLSMVLVAGAAAASETVESQDQAAAAQAEGTSSQAELQNATEVELCLDQSESLKGGSDLYFIPPSPLFQTTTSWNCNGCIEPSPCQDHWDCGYPQGRCIQGSCRCICD